MKLFLFSSLGHLQSRLTGLHLGRIATNGLYHKASNTRSTGYSYRSIAVSVSRVSVTLIAAGDQHGLALSGLLSGLRLLGVHGLLELYKCSKLHLLLVWSFVSGNLGVATTYATYTTYLTVIHRLVGYHGIVLLGSLSSVVLTRSRTLTSGLLLLRITSGHLTYTMVIGYHVRDLTSRGETIRLLLERTTRRIYGLFIHCLLNLFGNLALSGLNGDQ